MGTAATDTPVSAGTDIRAPLTGDLESDTSSETSELPGHALLQLPDMRSVRLEETSLSYSCNHACPAHSNIVASKQYTQKGNKAFVDLSTSTQVCKGQELFLCYGTAKKVGLACQQCRPAR